MLIHIFAVREPAKPLNDAQMCGSFFLYTYGYKKFIYENVLITKRFGAVTSITRVGNIR